MGLPDDALERSRHVCVQPVVTSNAGDALIGRWTIAHRPARNEHLRPAAAQCACDPAPDTEAPAGNDCIVPARVFIGEGIAKMSRTVKKGGNRGGYRPALTILTGNITTPRNNASTPSTAIPRIRNGISRIHMIG